MGAGPRAAILGAAACLALLVGCVPLLPLQSLSLADGALVLSAPRGYCIDGMTSRPEDGFAVMAPCASFGQSGPVPEVMGLVAVQLGAAGSAAVRGAEGELAALLRSPAGAALLSATGQAETVRLGGVTQARGRVDVAFVDSAPQRMPGTDGRVWRSFFDMGDRLVTVSVRSPSAAPLTDAAARALLAQADAALIAGGGGA